MEVMTRLDTEMDFLLKGSMSGLLFVLLPKLFLFGPRPPHFIVCAAVPRWKLV